MALVGAFSTTAKAADDVIVPADDNWAAFAATGNSGSTFVRTTAQKPAGSTYSYSTWNYSATQKNLWLSTPAMELAAGTTYTLDLQYQTWTSFKVENFEIYISDVQVSSNDLAAQLAGQTPVYRISEHMTANKNEWLPLQVENIVPGEGQKYLVFHASGECQGRFSIADVKLTAMTPALPTALAPTGLTALAQDSEIAVDLAWTLPSEDSEGNPLTGDNAITSVAVYRNGDKIASVEGAATSFTDTEATGLVGGGPYTYAVAAVAAGREGAASDQVSVAWVGPWSFSQATVTVSSDANPAADAWSYSRNNTSFIIRSNSANPGNGFSNSVQTWNNASLSDIDAWISSPQLNVPVGKTIKISFYFRFNPNVDTEVSSIKAYLSAARAAAGSTEAETAKTGQLLFERSAAKGDITSNTAWEQVVVKGLVPETTPLYLNFNITGTVCKGVYISGLVVEQYTEKPFAPAAPAALTATAADNQKLEVALNWENPVADTDGIAFGEGQSVETVYIYRDDFETPAVTLDGNVNTFTDTAESGLTPGAHSYKVKVVVAGAVSAFSNEATVSYVGPATTQTLPWEPVVTGLGNDEFKTLWLSWNASPAAPQWTNRPAGIFLMNNSYATCGSWLISAPLELSLQDTYIIEYSLTSSEDATRVQIGFVDSTTPTEFLNFAEATVGTPSECKLTLRPAAQNRTADAPDYRLAVRDVTPDPESSYNVILKGLKVSKSVETGIDGAVAEGAQPVAVFNLSGVRVAEAPSSALPAGIYIVRYADGSARKYTIR